MTDDEVKAAFVTYHEMNRADGYSGGQLRNAGRFDSQLMAVMLDIEIVLYSVYQFKHLHFLPPESNPLHTISIVFRGQFYFLKPISEA